MAELAQKNPEARPGFLRGVGVFILWLVRLTVAVGLGVLLGVSIYYVAYIGVPWFYGQVLSPIQVNSVKVGFLEEDIQGLQANTFAELRAARDEILTLQTTTNQQAVLIHSLESALAAEKTSREQLTSGLRADLNRVDEATQRQGIAVGQLESSTKKITTDLTTAGEQVAKLDGGLTALQKQAQTSDSTLKTLGDSALKISGDLKGVQSDVLGLREVITMPITLSNAFERRLALMQASEGILKARIHLLEKNAGYASQALTTAREQINRFVALSTDISQAQLDPLTKRAETAYAQIESDPFTAVQELEIIWSSMAKMIATPVPSTVKETGVSTPAAASGTTATVAPAGAATGTPAATTVATRAATTAGTATVAPAVGTPATPAATPTR